MKTLNQYTHNLAGQEIIYDNGNWGVSGRWKREVYLVHDDSTIQHIKTQNFWCNVAGEEETHSEERYVPDCDGTSIYVAGVPCKMPVDAEFELRPQHTCQAPRFHAYTYTTEGHTYTERFGFCDPSEANRKWKDYIAHFPQYTFDLLSVERTA